MELVEDRNGLRKEGRRPVDLSEESGYLRAFLAGERHNLTYRISGARAEAGRSVGRLLTWYSPQVEVAQAQSSSRGGYERKWLLVCFLRCAYPTGQESKH